jgi:hypothetical protein
LDMIQNCETSTPKDAFLPELSSAEEDGVILGFLGWLIG